MTEPTTATESAPRHAPSRRTLRVLFINDTARNGGPGRSLFYILKFLDPTLVHRAVVLPREGVIADLLRGGGVVDELWFEPNLVENPIEPFRRAMERADFDAPARIKAARFSGNLLKASYGLYRLRAQILEGRFDLIYCNGTNANFAGAALGRLTGVPVLWHVRYTSIPVVVRHLHTRLVESAAVKRIVCVSRAAATLFPSVPDKVKVIHNALDVSEFDPAKVVPRLRTEWGLPADAVVFGSQGRILPRKGYIEMIRAARRAIDILSTTGGPRVHFVIVGDTPEDMRPDHLAECKALATELGISGLVTFTGFVRDVKPLVAGFDVAVVPSVYPDPLPRAVLESMALGKPVIAFDMGGVAEMLEDGRSGQLVVGSPPDVEGLARAFVRYAKDHALRVEQGLAARRRIERDFDGRTQARKIEAEIVHASGAG
jgi:glycosyltransferase involved in cell wall biosynthesis